MTTEARLERMETTLNRMDKALFGNGNPGVIKEHDERLKMLENWKSKVVGIAGVAGLALGAVTTHFVEKVIR